MRCYYHQQAEAVGTCKNCNKGLFGECAVDVADGLACKDRCETQVRTYNQLVATAAVMSRLAMESIVWSAVFAALLAVGFVLMGLYLLANQDVFDRFYLFPIFMSLVMLASAVYLLALWRRLQKG